TPPIRPTGRRRRTSLPSGGPTAAVIVRAGSARAITITVAVPVTGVAAERLAIHDRVVPAARCAGASEFSPVLRRRVGVRPALRVARPRADTDPVEPAVTVSPRRRRKPIDRAIEPLQHLLRTDRRDLDDVTREPRRLVRGDAAARL